MLLAIRYRWNDAEDHRSTRYLQWPAHDRGHAHHRADRSGVSLRRRQHRRTACRLSHAHPRRRAGMPGLLRAADEAPLLRAGGRLTGYLLDENLPRRLTFTPSLPVTHAIDLGASPTDTQLCGSTPPRIAWRS